VRLRTFLSADGLATPSRGKLLPLFVQCHWNQYGIVPPTLTRNVAVAPRLTQRFVGVTLGFEGGSCAVSCVGRATSAVRSQITLASTGVGFQADLRGRSPCDDDVEFLAFIGVEADGAEVAARCCY
jgi:hypothetical protein